VAFFLFLKKKNKKLTKSKKESLVHLVQINNSYLVFNCFFAVLLLADKKMSS